MSIDGQPITARVRRWQIPANNERYTIDKLNVTWCRGWSGPDVDALEALVALEHSR